ncbi:MAG TPA: hypothetical protein VFZ22_19325 [Pyrinomonadaceae bacterium]|nr:hypothetical protein [Pyrinomonadaceae bacterium]
MSVSEIFQHFVQVSATLRAHFPDAPNNASEIPSQYSSSHIVDLPWLQQHLPPLADVLLLSPAFKLTLQIDVAGYKVTSDIERDGAGNLNLSGHKINDSALSRELQQQVMPFADLFTHGPISLNTVANGAVALTGVGIKAQLDLFLDKKSLNRSLALHASTEVTSHVVSYLFQNQFINKLANTTVNGFENEFLSADKPTVFLIFDFPGGLAGNFITVCGQGQHQQVETLLSRPIPDEVLMKARPVLEFRQSQSFGNFAPQWLMPEFFALAVTRGDPQEVASLKRALQQFQPALAAIFMADFVEANAAGIYSVEYRAFRPKRFLLDRDEILAQEQHWPKLYDLYQYAYDGISGDKLEIVQQFISQFADDVPTLCAKASDIRAATKKTHDRTLVKRVQEYFAARQSIQERIQAAVAALTNDTINLSRDVSADLYKVMGLIALAIAGWFFNSSIGLVALLLGFGAMGIYLLIVIVYYMPTLKRATVLRKSQHDAYINSFDDVLTPDEIQAFLANNDWQQARTMFENKLWWTRLIYLLFAVASFAAAVGAVIAIWRKPANIPSVESAVASLKFLLSYLPFA